MKRTLDWNEYLRISAKAVSEGCVLLCNQNGALPLKKDSEVSVFGRIQLHYYKSGTGSGGMVNVSEVIGITEGLKRRGAKLNEELLEVYRKWDSENPYEQGMGWGAEPWSQAEMPLDDEIVSRAAQTSDTAVVIIGRTAGEEQDNSLTEGSYLLSELEENMLRITREYFSKVVVLLNVGSIIDMSFVKKYSPDAVMYVWQGGMVGGLGTADVLLGTVSPSGKLPDTIAKNVSDYPSADNFGDPNRDFYEEDIYVGYRYFETFAKDAVLYPFGFGMSYTDFEISFVKAEICDGMRSVAAEVKVKNIGEYSGKEVVQVYCEAPQGKLGKPARVLCAYAKTKELAPGESQTLKFRIMTASLASYDDGGVTGRRACFVLEKGDYKFWFGTDVRTAKQWFSFTLDKGRVTKRCRTALAPVLPFRRMKNNNGMLTYERVPLSDVNESLRRLDGMPDEIPYTGDKGIKLADVYNGKNTLDEFVAQLSDLDLSYIIRGEGMGSPRVTAGTAAAFGGVSESLAAFGIPAGCCSDGPSGMRLDCGTKAFSLPNGTMLASTFNSELLTELFTCMGLEMHANKVDCLLGPGMNIHRHPLNGRNFEYFSEDPYLTGMTAVAELKGLQAAGVTGTIKHFCGNNQETNRHFLDSVISERALREIYLRGFEIAIRRGGAQTIMTTYGSLNGVWTAANYDLTTEILRDEWGFKGFAMTDWWANINRRGKQPDKSDFAAMAMAQNDVYMTCPDDSPEYGNTIESLEKGELRRAELQRNAKNVLEFLLETHAMKRLMGIDDETEIINRPADGEIDSTNVEYFKVGEDTTIDLSKVCTDKGTSYAFVLDMEKLGFYSATITASSEQSELAQIPVSLFALGIPIGTMTWNGTNGEPVSMSREFPIFSRFEALRLYFAQSGIKLHSIRMEYLGEQKP